MTIELHLWASHAAAVGAIAALVLLLAAHRMRDESVFKLAYGFVMAVAVAAAVSYFTGPLAYERLEALYSGIETPIIENHAVVGKAAFVILMLVGVVDLSAIMQYVQGETPGRAQRWGILAGTIVAVAVLVWAAHLGGLIRHPEIR